MMETLQAKTRDMSIKARKLRREGILPASVGGRDLKQSLSITLSEKDVIMFMKSHTVGSKTTLVIDGKDTYSVLIKSADYDPMHHQFLEMTFQALVSDEKVKSQAELVFINEDKALGFLTRTLQSIEYKAYPADLVDRIEIDISKYPIGTNLTVGDLDFAKNEKVDITTPLDATVLHVAAHKHMKAEDEAVVEAAEAAEAGTADESAAKA